MKTTIYYLMLNQFSFVAKGRFTIASHIVLLTLALFVLFPSNSLNAQSITGSTWDAASSTAGSGYTNWGGGVISLTDTTTGSGVCQGSAVTETSGYNPTTNFSQCYRVFFGCPQNDQIGTLGNPYTDQNGDGMAFSFWKNSATFNANNSNTCGGGLGYDNSVSDAKMITIEFDTYSSLGTSTVDGSYGGGAPGSGIDDEISLHRDANSNDGGLIGVASGGTVNAGNLEDGLQHDVCIAYNATTHILTVSLDAVTKVSYDLGGSDNLNTYFSGATLNYSWTAGKYGANNLQTIGPAGSNLFAFMGRNPCTQVVMPVSLLAFTGEMIGSSVMLNWSTANETNNAKFEIERSVDGIHWETIGEVAGTGNSTNLVNYDYLDASPNGNVLYYRLKQVDFNGDFFHSNVVKILSEVQQIFIGPNPFDDEITIKTNSKETVTVSINDVVGRLVYQVRQKTTDGVLQIVQPDLAPGAYIITVESAKFIERQKLIKK